MSPCPSNTYTKAAQFEGLSAEARYRLQKGGGAIFEMVKKRKSDSPPAKNYSALTGGHHHKPQKVEIELFHGCPGSTVRLPAVSVLSSAEHGFGFAHKSS
jgi:hypothetical protein